jgi:hypothetical protein
LILHSVQLDNISAGNNNVMIWGNKLYTANKTGKIIETFEELWIVPQTGR